MSYLINSVLYDVVTPYSLAAINFPADTYWIANGNAQHPIGFTSGDRGIDQPSSGINRLIISKDTCPGRIQEGGYPRVPVGYANPGACARHLEGNIIVYVDGHAKWERWNQTKGYRAVPGRATP